MTTPMPTPWQAAWRLLITLAMALSALALSACGSGDDPSPPAPATISAQPSSASVQTNAAAVFSVAATGEGLAYQWQRSTDSGASWQDLAGANAASYTVAAPTVAMSGQQFRVVVSGGGASVTSAVATLTVQPAPALPAIATQPSDVSVQAPQTAVFSVVASGTPAPSFQWQRSSDNGSTWADIAGATGASTTTAATTLADSGKRFRVRVSNTVGDVISSAAVLTVSAAPVAPAITSAPANQAVTAPAPATFTAVATGTPSPSLQWQLSTDGGSTFNNINGATAASYTTAATTAGDSGRRYRVLASNSAGTATSGAAVLTVSAGGGSGGDGGGNTTAGPCSFQGALSTGFTAEVVSSNSLNAGQLTTTTLRVNGPAVFQGQPATEFEVGLSNPGAGLTGTIKSYGSWNGSTGASTSYGSVGTNTTSLGGFVTSSTVNSVYTPAFVDLTYTLRVGQSVTQTAVQSITTTSTVNGVPGAPVTQVDSTTSTTQLVALESVTVPAGTFNTCRLLITKAGETGGVTLWLLANLGLQVKSEASGITTSAVSITVNGTPLK